MNVKIDRMTRRHVSLFEKWLKTLDLDGMDRLEELIDRFDCLGNGDILYSVHHSDRLEGGIYVRHEYLQNIWVRTQRQGIGRAATYLVLKDLPSRKDLPKPKVNAPNPFMVKVLEGISNGCWSGEADYVEICELIPPTLSACD